MSDVSDLLCDPLVPGHHPQLPHHPHHLPVSVHPGNDLWHDGPLDKHASWSEDLSEQLAEGDKMMKKNVMKRREG